MRQARGGVLVVGGGFAGGYVARLLGERGATIVSPENFMLYTPMLPEAASGTLEPRHTVVPLRQMCPHAELVLGRVTAIDDAQQSVHVETEDAGTFDIGYDHLVLALGAVPRTFPVPGLAEHGVGFKDLPDAINLRNRVLRELEAADAEIDPSDAALAPLGGPCSTSRGGAPARVTFATVAPLGIDALPAIQQALRAVRLAGARVDGAMTMAEVAKFLQNVPGLTLRAAIVDQTGLPGRYDVALDIGGPINPRRRMLVDAESDAGARGALLGSDLDLERRPIAVREALEKQLGLKLVNTKAEIPMLKIEHAENPQED